MKQLHVTNTISEGGAESLLLTILGGMVADGHIVDLLVLNASAMSMSTAFKSVGVNVIRGKYSYVYNPLNIAVIVRQLNKRQYDVVHAHLFPTQYFVAAAKIFSCYKALFITTEHGSTNGRRGKRLLRPIEKFVYNRYDKIVGVSRQATDALRAWIGLGDKFVTISNGVDLALFSNVKPYTNAELSLPADARKVIMVARFFAAKDHTTAIKSIAELPSNIHLLLVGSGNIAPFKLLCEQIGVAERVHFLGSRTDVPQLIQSCDVGLLATHGEGFSISIIEAMACGKPMVASDVPGAQEVVTGAGLLYEPKNPKDLAVKIASLLDNADHYREIANKCMARAVQYDIKNTINNYQKLYEQCKQRN